MSSPHNTAGRLWDVIFCAGEIVQCLDMDCFVFVLGAERGEGGGFGLAWDGMGWDGRVKNSLVNRKPPMGDCIQEMG